eukprot:gene14519-19491_t
MSANALIEATKLGLLDEVKSLIGQGADPAMEVPGLHNALETACVHNQLKVLEYFLQVSSVDINQVSKQGRTLGHVASYFGRCEILGFCQLGKGKIKKGQNEIIGASSNVKDYDKIQEYWNNPQTIPQKSRNKNKATSLIPQKKNYAATQTLPPIVDQTISSSMISPQLLGHISPHNLLDYYIDEICDNHYTKDFRLLLEQHPLSDIMTELIHVNRTALNATNSKGFTVLQRISYFAYNNFTPDIIKLLKLLVEESDPTWESKDGKTALQTASFNDKNGQVVEIFLQNLKIDINYVGSNGFTALHSAAKAAVKNNNDKIVHVLLEAGADPFVTSPYGTTPRQVAEEEILMKEYDHEWSSGAAQWAIKRLKQAEQEPRAIRDTKNWKRYCQMLSNENDTVRLSEAFIQALSYSSLEIVIFILNLYPSVLDDKSTGYSVVHVATCYNNDVEILTVLFDEYGRRKIPFPINNIENDQKSTPLHLAAELGRVAIVDWLLKRGASFNLFNAKGFSPVHEACAKGHTEVVRLFLDNGVQKDFRPPIHNWILLHSAARYGHIDVVLLLEERNCDYSLAIENGRTALDITVQEAISISNNGYYSKMHEDVLRHLMAKNVICKKSTLNQVSNHPELHYLLPYLSVAVEESLESSTSEESPKKTLAPDIPPLKNYLLQLSICMNPSEN